MKRKGKTLTVLPDGARRRMSDGKNAWRKMNDEQRQEFLKWIGLSRRIGDGVSRSAVKDEARGWILADRAWEEA